MKINLDFEKAIKLNLFKIKLIFNRIQLSIL